MREHSGQQGDQEDGERKGQQGVKHPGHEQVRLELRVVRQTWLLVALADAFADVEACEISNEGQHRERDQETNHVVEKQRPQTPSCRMVAPATAAATATVATTIIGLAAFRVRLVLLLARLVLRSDHEGALARLDREWQRPKGTPAQQHIRDVVDHRPQQHLRGSRTMIADALWKSVCPPRGTVEVGPACDQSLKEAYREELRALQLQDVVYELVFVRRPGKQKHQEHQREDASPQSIHRNRNQDRYDPEDRVLHLPEDGPIEGQEVAQKERPQA
mmetsp:Transcript_29897/g.99085  ORF Transcript_29897/g.99085 Transcript_29897/m.99085 type:complete len:275 (+) Transcript_29897:371-1195(+)